MTTETKEHSQPSETATSLPIDNATRLARTDLIIHRNVLWALGVGVIPFPVVDVLALTGVQAKMLKEMSALYEVSFREDLAKKLVGALLASLGGVGFGLMLSASLVKLLPGLGTMLGVVSVPVMAGAFTHATGRVFVMHFESGGTLLDFDPRRMREHFRAEFESAKERVAQMKKDPAAAQKPA